MDQYIAEQFEKLHGMPELGYTEKRTSTYLADCLEAMGYQVRRNIGTTGIIGVMDSGVDGPHFALRADMDALPFTVDGKETVIHACGHDANCAMVLTAARRAAERGVQRGKLYILFQQAEERMGAIPMAQTGEMAGIEEMVAVHLRPAQEAVLGEAACGVAHSATYHVEVLLKGRTNHGARPHLGVNVIDMAAAIINAVNAIHENPIAAYSVKATQMETLGNAKNNLPDTCRLLFDLRGESNEVVDSIAEKLEAICHHTAEMFGGAVERITKEGVPAACLDPKLTDLCDQAITRVLGKSIGIIRTAAGDDIYYFDRLCGIKIAYIGIGADMEYSLHHPKMCFNHHAMEIGADILEQVIDLRLGLGPKS